MMADPCDGSPAAEAVHLLLTIHRHLRRYSKQVSAELGISGRQLAALRYLREAGPLSVGQVSAHLFLADSTTSELLGGLETLGLLTRSRLPEDNRVAMVALTPAGQALVGRAPLGGIGLLRERLRTQPPEQVSALADALIYLTHLMEIDANASR